ncbi:tyrosine-protein phosphatase [Prauserella oleivorans]|uniref:Tyrosine-protein phosphatase n=1 Tax=Prauserella oleivorans TaxID=1478153 RepID=A0ABW5W7P9_9PSEU
MLWIELEGAVNIRDVGGIPTTDGGTTARNQLLRADNLQDLSRRDLDYLVGTVGLSTVVDLRTAKEIEAEGPAPLRKYAHIRHVHHSLLPEGDEARPDALLTRGRERNGRRENGDHGDHTVSSYLGFVAHRPDSIVGALRAITTSPGPALVHCAAGKDRTGVVVAFALTVAGAEREAIVRDYAATAERIEAILRRLRASATYAEDIDRVPLDHHTPRAESMARFLDQVDQHYGGVLDYLGTHGFGADDAARLRDKLRA